jgi:hypothetical protein
MSLIFLQVADRPPFVLIAESGHLNEVVPELHCKSKCSSHLENSTSLNGKPTVGAGTFCPSPMPEDISGTGGM